VVKKMALSFQPAFRSYMGTTGIMFGAAHVMLPFFPARSKKAWVPEIHEQLSSGSK
jgi:hypothetical protein